MQAQSMPRLPAKTLDARSQKLINRVARKRWVVNVQSPPEHCQGVDNMIHYLAAYVVGSPLGNRRVVKVERDHVTIRYKDYRKEQGGELRLRGTELVRRFCLHILPRGMRRVRYKGMFRPQHRAARLRACQQLIEAYRSTQPASVPLLSPTASPIQQASAQPLGTTALHSPAPPLRQVKCRRCNTAMNFEKRHPQDETMLMMLHVRMAILQFIHLLTLPPGAGIADYLRQFTQGIIHHNHSAVCHQFGRLKLLNVDRLAFIQLAIEQEIDDIIRLHEAKRFTPPARAGPETDVILAGCGCYVVL
jgi:hypothetical protein